MSTPQRETPALPPPTSRRRSLVVAGLLLAVVLAWLNGLFVRVINVDFQLWGSQPDRGDYLSAAGGNLATAAILVVGLLPLFVFSAPRWLKFVAGAGVGTQLALGITEYLQAGELSADRDGSVVTEGVTVGMQEAFAFPGSWPLLILVVAGSVIALRRGSSGS